MSDFLANTHVNIPSVEAFIHGEALLAASDYDGTQVRTFEPSPEGIGVNEAYHLAIGEVLGSTALDQYVLTGGHHNRTPTEIVASLIPECDPQLLQSIHEKRVSDEPMEDVLDFVHGYHHDHKNNLGESRLDDVASLNKPLIEAVTSVMTEAKLQVLTAQVGLRMDDGSMWPRPTAGFVEYAKAVDHAKAEGEPITTAVVSAGHAAFILKTYEMYGIAPPDVLITDETIQAVNPTIPLDRRSKPAPFPMALMKTLWLKQQGVPPEVLRVPDLKTNIDARITYIGDDMTKDGGLAKNGKVAFVPLDNPDDPTPWGTMAHRLGLSLEQAYVE